MKFKSLFFIFFGILFIVGCGNDDSDDNPQTIVPDPDPNPDTTELVGVLDTLFFARDTSKSLLVYNGANVDYDSLIVIAKDTFKISPLDDELVLGKKYTLSKSDESYSLYRTEMPMVILDTEGEEIPDEPKIGGTLKLLNPGDEPFESFIGIERRGGLSQTFPKKSYSVELWEDELGEDDRKESLLGLREDDDWILDGLWNEPLRIRDFTSHDIWLQMARFNFQEEEPEAVLGINRKYCEVFLNGMYRGIYYLGEKIDRKQLKLKKYDEGTRGELFKGDYWADGVVFDAVEDFSNSSDTWSGYEAKYPDEEGELDWTNLHGFVSFVVESEKTVFDSEIGAWADIQNMADYFIFLNLMYAIDNVGKNVYTARHDAGSPYVFVAWDMDGTFGNSFTGERLADTNSILSNGIYDRFLENNVFITELKSRWNFLKGGMLSQNNLSSMFFENFSYLKNNGAYEREEMDETFPFNYSDTEVDFINDWIGTRLNYLDDYINGL